MPVVNHPRSIERSDQSIQKCFRRGPLPGDSQRLACRFPNPENVAIGGLLPLAEERFGTECAEGTLDGIGVQLCGASDVVDVHGVAVTFKYLDRCLKN